MQNLIQRVTDFLKSNPDQKFTGREIGQNIFELFPDESERKKAKSRKITTDSELIDQYAAEIAGARTLLQKNTPAIQTTEGRPRRYFYSERPEFHSISHTESSERQETPSAPFEPPIREHDLYPKLGKYLESEYGIHSVRINEKRAQNTRGPGGNRWLYPDVVALEDLTVGWEREIADCASEIGARKARLWSFEVKLSINRSNVRECFFQTVSNSSWANRAYLVAPAIEGAGTADELSILSALHGVGVIRLEEGIPQDSEILYHATERSLVDWNAANRLAAENSDFRTFVKTVWQFHRSGAMPK